MVPPHSLCPGLVLLSAQVGQAQLAAGSVRAVVLLVPAAAGAPAGAAGAPGAARDVDCACKECQGTTRVCPVAAVTAVIALQPSTGSRPARSLLGRQNVDSLTFAFRTFFEHVSCPLQLVPVALLLRVLEYPQLLFYDRKLTFLKPLLKSLAVFLASDH